MMSRHALPSADSQTEDRRIKVQIEEQLSRLIGLPVCAAGRAVDMATFGFGRQIERQARRGLVEIPEYRLHVQETWRITNLGRVLLGYADWHYPPRGSTALYDDFDASDEPRNRQDDLRDDWLAHGPEAHTVAATAGSEAGDLRIDFADGCILETFVNQATSAERGDEFWRLLPPESISSDAPHFVVTAHGLSPY